MITRLKSHSRIRTRGCTYNNRGPSHSGSGNEKVKRKLAASTVALVLLTSLSVAGVSPSHAEGSEKSVGSQGNAAGARAIRMLVTTFNPDEKGDADGIANVIHDLIGNNPNTVGVAGLQELCQDERNNVIDELRAKSGQTWDSVYQLNDRGGGRASTVCENGNAVIANRGISGIALVPFDRQHPEEKNKNDETRGYVRATLQVDGINIHVYSTHLTSGSGRDRQAVRRAQVRQLVRDVRDKDLPGPRIVLGDFNATPGAPELRPLYRRLDGDGVDTPTTSKFIGPCPPRGEEQAKIDHIFVSPSISVRRAFVPSLSDEANPSDGHCPVVAHLRVPRR